MDRWPSTTKIIVIHRGQIIVHKAEGMHALDGDRGGNGVRTISPDRFTAAENQDGAYPLPAAKDGILHRLLEAGHEFELGQLRHS